MLPFARQRGMMTNVAALMGGGPAPFVGLTGLGYHNNFSSTGSFSSSMTRKPIVASDDMADVKVGFGLFTIDPTGTSENVDGTGGHTYTVRAAIEYGGAIVARLTFANHATGDNTTGQAVSGSGLQLIESDLCALSTTIPSGATFYVRFYTTGALLFYTGSPANWTSATGECFNFDASPTDLTGSTGTFTNSDASLTQSPVYVACTKTSPSVGLVGDSKGAGYTGSGVDTFSTTAHRIGLLRGVPTSMGYYTAATSSTTCANWESTAANRKTIMKYCSHVVWEHAINDINNGRSAAQLISDKQALISSLAGQGLLLAGAKQIWATCEPNTTGTFTSTAGQTVFANEAVRASYNSLIKAGGIPQCDGFLDVAAQVEATGSDAGKWLANLTTDGLHEDVAGYDAVAAWLATSAASIFTR